jgi:hypothetical protein
MDLTRFRTTGRRCSAITLTSIICMAALGACASPAATPTPASSAVVEIAAATAGSTTTPAAPASSPAPAAPPFGPAVNGALFYADAGTVFRLDSPTATPRSILTDHDLVLPSKDGTALALARKASGGWQFAVADPEGRDVRTLPGSFPNFSEIDWAPTGDELAIISEFDRTRALTILAADGSGSRTLALAQEPDGFWYLPDGRIIYIGTVEPTLGDTTHGLYVVDPADGRVTTVAQPPESEKTIAEAAVSPDGTTVVYHAVGGEYEVGRLRLMDIDGSNDRPLGAEEPNEEFADQGATFSRDGRQVLFTRFTEPGTTLSLVPTDGGPVRAIGEMAPGNDMAIAAFSPDGTQVIAYYPNGHLWLLDATGTGEDVQLDLPVRDMPTWQRIGR